jgi:hypothetical protein
MFETKDYEVRKIWKKSQTIYLSIIYVKKNFVRIGWVFVEIKLFYKVQRFYDLFSALSRAAWSEAGDFLFLSIFSDELRAGQNAPKLLLMPKEQLA